MNRRSSFNIIALKPFFPASREGMEGAQVQEHHHHRLMNTPAPADTLLRRLLGWNRAIPFSAG